MPWPGLERSRAKKVALAWTPGDEQLMIGGAAAEEAEAEDESEREEEEEEFEAQRRRIE